MDVAPDNRCCIHLLCIRKILRNYLYIKNLSEGKHYANVQMSLIWPATSGEFFGEGNLLFILQIYQFIIASYWKY